METLKEQLEEIKEQITEQPEQTSAESISVSPNYKGKHPLSKEELAKRKGEKKRVYECKDLAVNPGHYKSKNGLEVIDCIEAFTEDLTGIEAVCVANVLKYICRYKKKNGLQDCNKALWYLTKLVKHLEEQDKKESK
jgi:hypothetical protein